MAESGERIEQEVRQAREAVEGSAREKASELRSKVEETASDLREQASGQLEGAKSVGVEKARHIERAIEAAGRSLEEDGESGLADYSRQAGTQLGRMADYLERNDVAGLMEDLEVTARRNPGAFIGATFAAGLVLGRFLRAGRPSDRNEAPASRQRVAHASPGSTRISEPAEPTVERTTRLDTEVPR